MFTDSDFLRISRKLCEAWRTQIHSEKDDVFLFALFSAHFNDAGIHPTSGRWEDLWQQLESVQSAKQTAPQLKDSCTAIHTQPYTTTVNPAAAGGRDRELDQSYELSTFTEVQFKVRYTLDTAAFSFMPVIWKL